MNARRERQLGLVTPQMQRYDAAQAADWLDAIKRQVCPFCNAGPFIVVAHHVNKVHGINRNALRDMLGIYHQESICDPTHSKAAQARGRRLHAEGRTGIHPMLPGTKKRLGPAALRLQKAKAALITDEQRQAVGQKTSRQRLDAAAHRDDRILALLDHGWTFNRIGDHVGVHAATVRTVARRRGRDEDGRARYWASRRGVKQPGLEAGRVARIARDRAKTAELVGRYESGATVYELADAEDVRVASMRERLRNAGVVLPDGRADPDRPITPRPKAPKRSCSLPGCDDVHRALGLCGRHYQQAKAGRIEHGCCAQHGDTQDK